ncbi:MAG: hypothetical protein PHW18_06435 [Sulfuricurvum sp.]|uniref:hypothetical protein n=1 Tax=Sulfuricurvum sp. TaxID=2025608 RepID=UPI0026111EEB|nr:hypothetical protein [Sulfuricurvum sp.]MDD2829194.1 hypothetical protein [Sulfuricurvum sp.]MDD4949027.1 hypothetical protein [Sulfuricurvum sp.]
MFKKSFAISILLACSLNASMFGDLAGSLMGSSDGTKTEMQAIFDKMDQSTNTLVASVELINGSLGDKKQLTKWDDQNKTIGNLTDDEKVPAIAKLNQEKIEYATALGLNKDAVTKAKKLPNDQKSKIGTAISDILLVSKQEKETANKAKDLVKSIVANPKSALLYAGDLPKLKDVVSNTPAMLSAQAALSKNLVILANSANITIQQPVATAEK